MYRLWGSIHSNGGQLPPDQAPPLGLLPPESEAQGASYSGVKRPEGDLLRGAISSVTVQVSELSLLLRQVISGQEKLSEQVSDLQEQLCGEWS